MLRRRRLRGPGHVKLIIATIVQTMGDPVSFGGVISAWHYRDGGKQTLPKSRYERRTMGSGEL